MGLLFGVGTMLMALFLAVKILPRLVGLAFWLGSVSITGGTALVLLYHFAAAAP